tara:strand:+ start:394 stop:579 length:186 start_codon:yes stop_codon:yes gene_type:complete
VKVNYIHAELDEIISNKISGRTDKDQITYFKSRDVAVQDVANTQIVVEEAKQLGLGTVVSL